MYYLCKHNHTLKIEETKKEQIYESQYVSR